MEQPGRGRPVADFRSELHAWLDAHHDELAPPYPAARNARRADRADAAREVDPVRRGLDALRVARARRRTRRVADAAHRARRGAGGPRPHRSRPLLAHRGARPDAHRLRAARARRRGRPAPAVGRRDVVPGVLGAGHRERPRVAELPSGSRRRRGHRVDVDRSTARRSGPAWRSTPTGACCSRGPDRRSRATGASPRSSSTWTRPGSRSHRSR